MSSTQIKLKATIGKIPRYSYHNGSYTVKFNDQIHLNSHVLKDLDESIEKFKKIVNSDSTNTELINSELIFTFSDCTDAEFKTITTVEQAGWWKLLTEINHTPEPMPSSPQDPIL